MSQPNLVTNTDYPAAAVNVPPMMPMWDADGRLAAADQDALPHSEYRQKDPIPQYQNGLVVGVSGVSGNQFQMFTCDNNDNDTFKDYALYGIQTRSPLSEVFFSKVNMNRLQKQLRYQVWTASGGKYQIGPQSETELMVIMRAIYLQHAKNLPYQIPEQVNELDRLVIDFCLPKVMSEVEQYLGYLKNLEYLPQPIPLPLNLSSQGYSYSFICYIFFLIRQNNTKENTIQK
jgi:hypothetical protein